MAEIILNYFSNLFSSNNPTAADQNKVLESMEMRIDGNMNKLLCTPFSAEEVKKAVFDLHPNKSPGPDGMSALFYHKFWHEIGREVETVVLRVLNEGAPLAEWNETIITLIPKTKNPMTMKEFRPISLCNVYYKIVARALTNRLRPILNMAITESQSAFVPGHLITDNIIIGFETIHWKRNRKKEKHGYAALKLDVSKAYDRVEWSFLERCMENLGFSTVWTEKVMRCVRLVKYSFAFNDEVIGALNPSRGLRQGDPLYLHTYLLFAPNDFRLFSLPMKLESCFQEFELLHLVHRYHIYFWQMIASYFSELQKRIVREIHSCLTSYERASDQLINFEKSSLLFNPNTNGEITNTIKSRLSIPIVQENEIYLGLPTFSLRSKKLQFRYLIENVAK